MILPLRAPTTALEFEVPGKPLSWQTKVIKKGKHASIKITDDSNAYQTRIGRAAHRALGRRERFDCALVVHLVCIFKRPRRLDRADPGRHPAPVAGPNCADLDKVARNVFDGLQRSPTGLAPRKGFRGVGIVTDDCRIVRLVAEKWYAAVGEEPRTIVRVWPWSASGVG